MLGDPFALDLPLMRSVAGAHSGRWAMLHASGRPLLSLSACYRNIYNDASTVFRNPAVCVMSSSGCVREIVWSSSTQTSFAPFIPSASSRVIFIGTNGSLDALTIHGRSPDLSDNFSALKLCNYPSQVSRQSPGCQGSYPSTMTLNPPYAIRFISNGIGMSLYFGSFITGSCITFAFTSSR